MNMLKYDLQTLLTQNLQGKIKSSENLEELVDSLSDSIHELYMDNVSDEKPMLEDSFYEDDFSGLSEELEFEPAEEPPEYDREE